MGASSLGECLAIQLKAMPRCPARQVALRICEQYLELLAKRFGLHLCSNGSTLHLLTRKPVNEKAFLALLKVTGE